MYMSRMDPPVAFLLRKLLGVGHQAQRAPDDSAALAAPHPLGDGTLTNLIEVLHTPLPTGWACTAAGRY